MPEHKLNIILFISTQCPHCAQALELLSKAVKQGTISELKIINLAVLDSPEQYAHIRSVPFIQIGDFEFTGGLEKTELDAWINANKSKNFSSFYISTLLTDGHINQVENFIKRKPDYWLELIKLAQDDETNMQVRIGITAIFESMSNYIPNLTEFDDIISSLILATKTKNHAIRVDLFYILSLIFSALKDQQQSNNTLKNFMTLALNDQSEEIKEIVAEIF